MGRPLPALAALAVELVLRETGHRWHCHRPRGAWPASPLMCVVDAVGDTFAFCGRPEAGTAARLWTSAGRAVECRTGRSRGWRLMDRGVMAGGVEAVGAGKGAVLVVERLVLVEDDEDVFDPGAQQRRHLGLGGLRVGGGIDEVLRDRQRIGRRRLGGDRWPHAGRSRGPPSVSRSEYAGAQVSGKRSGRRTGAERERDGQDESSALVYDEDGDFFLPRRQRRRDDDDHASVLGSEAAGGGA